MNIKNINVSGFFKGIYSNLPNFSTLCGCRKKQQPELEGIQRNIEKVSQAALQAQNNLQTQNNPVQTLYPIPPLYTTQCTPVLPLYTSQCQASAPPPAEQEGTEGKVSPVGLHYRELTAEELPQHFDQTTTGFFFSGVLIKDKVLDTIIQSHPKSLQLINCKIEDRVISKLMLLDCLVNLTISDNVLTDSHVALLGPLTNLKQLTIIRSSQITSEFFRQMKIYAPNLETLLIREMILSDTAFEGISWLPQLKELRILRSWGFSKEGVGYLCKNPLLEKLSLWRCKNVNNKAIEKLARHPSLKVVDLTAADVTSGATQFLATIPRLSELILKESKIDDDAMKYLGGASNLKTLDCSYCDGLTEKAFNRTAPNSLAHFNLTGCTKVGNNALAFLAQRCLKIVTLILKNCPTISNEGFLKLANLSIGLLDLSGTKVTESGFEKLPKNSQIIETLKTLRLNDCPAFIEKGGNHLLKCQSLSEVRLIDSLTDPGERDEIIERLSTNSHACISVAAIKDES